MRKIQLNISHEKDWYLIRLDFGIYFKFSSKKAAKRFRSSLQVIFTDYARALMNNNSLLELIYSTNYAIWDPGTKNVIDSLRLAFHDRYDHIYKAFSPGNNNYFVISNLRTCFSHQKNMVSNMKSFANLHKNYALNAQLSGLNLNLNILEDSLTSAIDGLSPDFQKTKVLSISHKNDFQYDYCKA